MVFVFTVTNVKQLIVNALGLSKIVYKRSREKETPSLGCVQSLCYYKQRPLQNLNDAYDLKVKA